MKIKDITRYELIGMNIKVVKSKNLSLINLKGKVIDETKSTITIESNNETKKLIKDQITIELKIKDKTIQIDGELLVGRPEERIKK